MSDDDIVQPDAVDSIGRLRAELAAVRSATYTHGCWICADAVGIVGAERAGLCRDHAEQLEAEAAAHRARYENELAAANADAERLADVAEHPGSYPWVWSSRFGASVPGERLYRILAAHRARIEGDQ